MMYHLYMKSLKKNIKNISIIPYCVNAIDKLSWFTNHWIFLQELQWFYLITVFAIFIFAMILQIPSLNINGNIKLAVFVCWAIYGVLPTLHWTIAMGGFDNPIVKLLIPRVIGMYIINAIAFAFYMFKIPERFCPGNYYWWFTAFVIVISILYYNTLLNNRITVHCRMSK